MSSGSDRRYARQRRRYALAALAGALSATLALAGCAAGQHAPTAEEISVVDGVAANIGPIQLRNIGVAAPNATGGYTSGGSAQLVMAVINNSQTDDQLTAVSSPAATTVTSEIGAAASAAGSPAGSGSSDSASPSTSSGTPSGTASDSSSSPSTSASSAPASFEAVSCPAGELVAIGYGDTMQATVTLQGLTQPLNSGESLAITFTFKNAGSVTVQIPVKVGPGASTTATVDVSPSGD